MEVYHLVHIHFIDVVAAEDRDDIRTLIRNQVDVLENGVCGAFVPIASGAHLCGHKVYILVKACVQVPGCRNMLV